MKVLVIGCYRDNTGWGHMCVDTILALITAGVDVTARPVKLNDLQAELPPQVIEAENKPAGSFDAVIQNVLPHQLEYSGNIPINVAYYCNETSRFDGTTWPHKINTMDRAWVCSDQSYWASKDSGVTIPILKLPIAANISKYQRNYKPLSIRDKFPDSFIFYYVGDFNTRKNIRALIQAFHLEFEPHEQVELVLKTNVGMGKRSKMEEIKVHEDILQEIDKVKHDMKLYKSTDYYKKEVVLTGNYSEEQIMRLHSSCDCFVCPSHGEAWCVPAFDAMAMGKTPIVSAYGGFLEYINWDNGYLVKGTEVPVWGMVRNTFDDLYTSREKWYDIDIEDLMRKMREAYNSQPKQKVLAGRKRAYDFSYEKVGKKMVEALS